MATTTRTTKSIKTASIAAAAYEANGVSETLNTLESASIWAYITSSLKLSIIAAWALVAGAIGALAYAKEMSKAQD
jgi:hypothetical protein